MFKVKWVEQAMVKLMRPNWIFCFFIASLSSRSLTCWKNLAQLGATCKVASTLATALPWQLGGS